ncbi:MAG: hypothetical protein JOZ79_00845 [Sphingomonas sp.]|nr:hypothetical protein [Sphingomonas sp.]
MALAVVWWTPRAGTTRTSAVRSASVLRVGGDRLLGQHTRREHHWRPHGRRTRKLDWHDHLAARFGG